MKLSILSGIAFLACGALYRMRKKRLRSRTLQLLHHPGTTQRIRNVHQQVQNHLKALASRPTQATPQQDSPE